MQEKTQLDPITTLSAMVGALNITIADQQAEIEKLQKEAKEFNETVAKIRKWAVEINKERPKNKRRGGGSGAKKRSTITVTNEQLESVFMLMRKHCGVNYQVLNPNGRRTAAAELLTSRLREGYTVEQVKGVVGRKWMDWKNDDKMRQFFRPETLFKASKFASYVSGVGHV